MFCYLQSEDVQRCKNCFNKECKICNYIQPSDILNKKKSISNTVQPSDNILNEKNAICNTVQPSEEVLDKRNTVNSKSIPPEEILDHKNLDFSNFIPPAVEFDKRDTLCDSCFIVDLSNSRSGGITLRNGDNICYTCLMAGKIHSEGLSVERVVKNISRNCTIVIKMRKVHRILDKLALQTSLDIDLKLEYCYMNLCESKMLLTKIVNRDSKNDS